MTKITFYDRVDAAFADTETRKAFDKAGERFTVKRLAAVAAYPEMEDRRDRARQIRAHTVAHLDEYLEQFADAVEALGGHIFWAKDAAEANAYIVDLAKKEDVKLVVKSKSMVSEETKINHALEALGIEVAESDLGEFIVQLAEEAPYHIIGPAIHKSRQQVGKLFEEKLDTPYTDDPYQLNDVARHYLRRRFLTADMGISGVNFGVAETGSICLVTNEGNGRLTTTTPRIHVAMMGMERIVPTIPDLNVMLQVLARSATGQKSSVYTNIVTGPRRANEQDGPEQLHIIILDNGRSRALASELAEILYCIRCGSCLNSCPVYREIGGHAYGTVYSGPMGSVLTPAMQGLDPWGVLPQASTLCGACKEACPVRIDIPHMLLKLRVMETERRGLPTWLKAGLNVYQRLAQHPRLFHMAEKMAGVASQPLTGDGWTSKLLPSNGWTKHRAFPKFAAKTFREQWKERQTTDE